MQHDKLYTHQKQPTTKPRQYVNKREGMGIAIYIRTMSEVYIEEKLMLKFNLCVHTI